MREFNSELLEHPESSDIESKLSEDKHFMDNVYWKPSLEENIETVLSELRLESTDDSLKDSEKEEESEEKTNTLTGTENIKKESNNSNSIENSSSNKENEFLDNIYWRTVISVSDDEIKSLLEN